MTVQDAEVLEEVAVNPEKKVSWKKARRFYVAIVIAVTLSVVSKHGLQWSVLLLLLTLPYFSTFWKWSTNVFPLVAKILVFGLGSVAFPYTIPRWLQTVHMCHSGTWEDGSVPDSGARKYLFLLFLKNLTGLPDALVSFLPEPVDQLSRKGQIFLWCFIAGLATSELFGTFLLWVHMVKIYDSVVPDAEQVFVSAYDVASGVAGFDVFAAVWSFLGFIWRVMIFLAWMIPEAGIRFFLLLSATLGFEKLHAKSIKFQRWWYRVKWWMRARWRLNKRRTLYFLSRIPRVKRALIYLLIAPATIIITVPFYIYDGLRLFLWKKVAVFINQTVLKKIHKSGLVGHIARMTRYHTLRTKRRYRNMMRRRARKRMVET